MMVFTKKTKQDVKIVCKLGTDIIPQLSQTTYAGITFVSKLICSQAISKSCEKGRKILNSLIGVGLHPFGINPVVATKLIKTIVVPSMLYGCELWDRPRETSVVNLERTLRYSVRRCCGYSKQSPTATTTQSVGLFNVWSMVEHRKLMFWNKLCRASFKFIWKTIFITRLCDFLFTSRERVDGFIPDILETMCKFRIENFFYDFVPDVYVPCHTQWKLFVRNVIETFYFEEWRGRLAANNSLRHYANIHESGGRHPLLTLGLKQPALMWKFIELIELSFTYERSAVKYDLIGCIVFCVFGIFFVGLAFCSVCRSNELQRECGGCRTDRRRYLYVAWFTLIGGLLLITTVIWFYVSQIRNAGGLYGINNSISNKADYSLALVAAAGGVTVILAVIIFFIRLRMYDHYDDDEYERRPRKRAPPPVMYMQEPPRMPRAEPPPYVVAPPSSYRYSYKGEPTYMEYGSSRRPAYPEKKKYITYGEY